MNGLSRLAILGLAVLFGASCASVPPTASTAALASSTPSPRPTPFPLPTPRYTMPPPRCPSLNELYRPPDVTVNFLTARGFAGPPTVAVGRPPLVVPFRPAIPGDRGEDSGVLLGGRTQRMAASVAYETPEFLQDSARLTSIELTLELPGRAPSRLRTAVASANVDAHETEIAVEGVPDTDAEGVLQVRIVWVDRCYEYVAEGPMNVRVASVASISGCAVGEEAVWRQLEELIDPPLAFGNGAADLGVTTVSSLLIDMPIIDGPYAVIMYDRDAPSSTARPGEAISFHSTNPDLVLAVREDRATVGFYARDAVIRHIDAGGGGPVPPVVAESRVELLDGRFVVHAPDVPGRYVAGISLDFTSACFTGGVVAGAGLDVVAR